jgi:hypothetical protein
VVEPLNLGDSFGTYGSPVEGRFRVAFYSDDLALFHVNQKPTPSVVHARAKGLNDHFLSLIHHRDTENTEV